MGRVQSSATIAVFLALTADAGSALAGSGGSSGCGCVPTTHQVRVPGIEITPPSVSVDIPTLNVSTASSSASSSAASSANVGVSVNSSSSGGVNTQAIINANGSGYGGGGGSWSDSGSVTTTIDSIKVETPAPVETRRICAAYKTSVKTIAVQASCLDDKSIPHPASQLGPDRDIADTYEGEVYRCIAGARMQYTVADYSGSANFDHGQTLTCQKGEALYHTAAGVLQCRTQKPARDCNERSLLRRFGAGIKVLKVSRSDICAAWRTETVEASAGSY
jgi:hypothetical protein